MKSRERGQSLVEFLFMLPILIGMAVMLIRISTAIQISIVDQQVARAQTFVLTDNSAVYPRLGLQVGILSKGMNQMVLGVSDNPASGSYTPEASVQVIGRTPRQAESGSNDSQSEPPLRSRVRIRNSVTLCTPTFLLDGSTPLLPLSGPTDSESGPLVSGWSGTAAPLDSAVFNYICGGTLAYE